MNATAASGGEGSDNRGTGGGNGGAVSTPNGVNGEVYYNAGGGGGGVGRIRINSSESFASNGIISPEPTTGNIRAAKIPAL